MKKKTAVIYSMIVIFMCFLPNLQSGLVSGSDSPYHLYRIYSLADALKNGVFPVKVHPAMAYGYGYGTGFFYSDVLLYIPAILILLGLSLATAYKCFALLVIALLYSSMYFCIRKTGRTVWAALLAATLYITSNEIIGGFYLDFRLGEMTGLIFMPIAIVGCLLFLKKGKSPLMMIAGFIGLMYTHSISGLLSAIVCVFILLYSILELVKKPMRILQLILSAALALITTASYWLPMWQQFRSTRYKVSAPWTTEEQNVQSIADVFGVGGIGLPIIICFALLLLLDVVISSVNRRTKKLESSAVSGERISGDWVFVTIVAVILIVLTCSYPFWHLLNSHGIHVIQFTSRLYGPITVMLCIAISILADRVMLLMVERRAGFVQNSVLITSGLLILTFAFCVLCAVHNYSANFMSSTNDVVNEVTNGEIAGIGAGEEWLPLETDRSMLTTPETAFDNEGESVSGIKTDGDVAFTFTADLSKDYYVVPYIFYRGYEVVDEAGNHYDVISNNGTGLLQVIMHGNDGNDSNSINATDGTVNLTVSFRGTFLLKLSYLASTIGIIAVIVYGRYWKRKRISGIGT